jgi:hypothetical protein
MAQPPLLSRRGNLLADTSYSGLFGRVKPGLEDWRRDAACLTRRPVEGRVHRNNDLEDK